MKFIEGIKNALSKKDKKEVETYNKGLEKTRSNLKNKLTELTLRHKKIDEEYFVLEIEKLLQGGQGDDRTRI